MVSKNSLKTFTILSVFVAILFLTSTLSFAEVPKFINYQGKLTDKSDIPLTGTYTMTFCIYDSSNTCKWTETKPVAVKKGIYNVILGSGPDNDPDTEGDNVPIPASIFNDSRTRLGVTVEGDSEMTPQTRLTSVPYAMTAENVVSIPRGVIVMWSGSIASIPSGWALCDGANGTPDLRDRFIVGAGNSYSVSATGGEAMHTLTIAEMPPHTHSYRWWNAWYFSGSSELAAKGSYDDNAQTGSTGGGQPHNNLPPYYALAYIMKL
ncbi:MAG: hypothetical protein HZA14_07350 [Nitrospirae bacterium]|nr:hypothetical protein [Nitrospirota bacterium]